MKETPEANQTPALRPKNRAKGAVSNTPTIVPTFKKEEISCCGLVRMFHPRGLLGTFYPNTFKNPTIAWKPAMVAESRPYWQFARDMIRHITMHFQFFLTRLVLSLLMPMIEMR